MVTRTRKIERLEENAPGEKWTARENESFCKAWSLFASDLHVWIDRYLAATKKRRARLLQDFPRFPAGVRRPPSPPLDEEGQREACEWLLYKLNQIAEAKKRAKSQTPNVPSP